MIQMRGARKPATGAYASVREDAGAAGNKADGSFLEVSTNQTSLQERGTLL